MKRPSDRRPPKPPTTFSRVERATSPMREGAHHSHSHDEHSPGVHPHSHGAHSHGHAFDAPPEPSSNAELLRGAGVGQLLLLDMPSGIAGDMTVAALLDLGVPLATVSRAVAALPLEGYALSVVPARSGAIGGSRFVVDVDDAQPERRYAEIRTMIERSTLGEDEKALAGRIFLRLAQAEAQVHRLPLDEVAFHEVGAVDAIVDIVGAAACFVHLGARVVATPVPLGRGVVECQHGLLPLPAPATLLCLSGVPTYDSGIERELVTPTGAAILATVAEEFVSWPSFAPLRVGWGCGTRDLGERPNAVRAILGQPSAEAAPRASHVVLEANVDDMTGELVAYAIEALLREGALDAWAAPVTMKKGRPGLVLSALAPEARAAELSRVMLRETSSIGVRCTPVSRTERPRRMVVVATRFGSIPVKVSEGEFGPALAKPEFDACAAAARAANVPVRDVVSAALAAYEASTRA